MSEPVREIGNTVKVLNKDNTYNTYIDWPGIEFVPKFEMEALPEEGKDYTITHIAEHGYFNEPLYVLDEQFIVGQDAFDPRKLDLSELFYD